MQSFLNVKKTNEREKEAIYIKTPLQRLLLNKANLSVRKLEKIMAIEKEHPFLMGQKELAKQLPKAYRIDYEKYLKLQQRGLKIFNAYKGLD